MGAVMSPQDRAASSPSPSPCTPCPRCCAPEKKHTNMSLTLSNTKSTNRIIVWPHLQSCEGWGWASRRAVCRRSWWIAPGAHFKALKWWCWWWRWCWWCWWWWWWWIAPGAHFKALRWWCRRIFWVTLLPFQWKDVKNLPLWLEQVEASVVLWWRCFEALQQLEDWKYHS